MDSGLPFASLQAGAILAAVSSTPNARLREIRPSYRLQSSLQPIVADTSTVPCLSELKVSLLNNPTKKNVSGKWKKNWQRSDLMDELYDVACLPWYLRKGEMFLKYLELEDTEQHFRRTFNAGGFLNVSEVYPKSGSVQCLPRRDQRSGVMEGHVTTTTEGPCTRVSWGAPHGLEMVDIFSVSEDGMTLTVSTTASRADGSRSITCKNIFNRVHEC